MAEISKVSGRVTNFEGYLILCRIRENLGLTGIIYRFLLNLLNIRKLNSLVIIIGNI